MHRTIRLALFLIVFGFFFAAGLGLRPVCAQLTFRTSSERYAMRAMTQIYQAEMTHFAQKGYFAMFWDLGRLGLIDFELAQGVKYGYYYTVFTGMPYPTNLEIWARPIRYKKSGVRSFIMRTNGEIHGGDKQEQPATIDDPVIDFDPCTMGADSLNENCTISSLRTLHSAEMMFAATTGNGNHGSLAELRSANLISAALAAGAYRGYSISVETIQKTTQAPAAFRISAVPQAYGTTGLMSFYIDESGVVRGADKGGRAATADDPVVSN